MKNIAKLFIVTIMITSCGDFEPVVYDNFNGQTLAYFDRSTSNLEVIIDDVGSVDIKIGVTTLSTEERSLTVALVPESTTAASDTYSFNPNVIIPANSYFGTLTISGIDNNVETTAELITLKIESIEGNGIASAATHAVSIFQVCPLTAPFTGEYFMEQLTPINPDDGVKCFEDQVLTITSTGTTNRQFKAVYLEGLGIGQPPSTVPFGLVCNEVIVASGIGTGLLCVQGLPVITLGPGIVPANYNADDDSVFHLTLTEYETDGGCGAAPYQTTFRFTKQ